MALDLLGIRKAVAVNARTAVGLSDTKEYRPDTSQGSPVLWVEIVDMEPSAMGRTRWHLELEATLIVDGSWDRSKQKTTDEMVPLVWTAIESDRTLGGLAHHINISSAQFMRAEDGPVGAVYRIKVEA